MQSVEVQNCRRNRRTCASDPPREIAAEFEKNVASCEPVSLAMRIQSMADSSQAIPGLFSTQSENRDHTRHLHPQARIQVVPTCESQIWCSFATGVSGKIGDRQTVLILLPWTKTRLWTGLAMNQPILRVPPKRGVYGKSSPIL